jgi:hypothetical protein
MEYRVTSISRRIALALAIIFTTSSLAQVPVAPKPDQQADRTEIESLPKGPVSGKVLDASTGKPISGARVEPSWIESRCTPWVGGLPLPRCARGSTYTPRVDPVITGTDGSFNFPVVPIGDIVIRARLKGFFDAASLHQKPYSSSGFFRVGSNSTGIEIRLIRRATVHGVIVDESGHPCAGWDVEYHSILLSQGRYFIESPPITVATAGDGTFSFEVGGDFYLTTPIHNAPSDSAGHPQAYPPSLWPAPDTPLTAISFSTLLDTGRDLPSTRHADPAMNLTVRMIVTSKPLHHITGTASTAESSNAVPVIYAEPRFGASFPLTTVSANGRVDLWLPDGEYALIADSQSEWARVPLTVAGQDIAGINIRTHSTVSVPIQIIGPGASDNTGTPSKVPFGFDLALMQESPVGVVNGAGVIHAYAKGDDVLVKYLLPDKYNVTTQSLSPSYVSSITAGGVDLNSHPYVVSDAGTVTPISVVLRKDGGALSGVVRKDGEPIDAYIYAIPLFPSTAAPLSAVSHPDGTYRLDGIPPGTYRIVALDSQEPMPYREPNAMKPWLLRGSPIKVGPNSVSTVDLEVEHR